ncbi:MAG: polysaccharide biosynthesis/export family protein [Crocinitomicaceae bacterium]
MRKRIGIVFVFLIGFIIQSCGVNSNVMFKEAKDEVKYDSIPLNPLEEYKISLDDKIKFTLTTNNGADIIEKMSGISTEKSGGTDLFEYIVRSNGEAELPIIGKIKLAGLTVEQAEDTMVKLFSSEYIDPFVQIKVTNQRVIVFPGNGSDAKVIPLLNSNTTLMEALAQAGGITDRGKANTIKLMRKVDGKRVVYGIDLSTMDGLQYVDMIVQANDYIYVEPTPEIGKQVAQNVVPIVSLISSAIVIISAINLFK